VKRAKLWVCVLLAGVLLAGLWGQAWAQGETTKRINAHLANEIIPLSSHATTVSGFIDELSIALPDGAVIDPPMEAALQDGMSVFLHGLTVTRGETEQVIEPILDVDESWRFGPTGVEIVDPGQSGLKRISCTLFYYDGHEVGRRTREDVIQRMRPQKIVYYKSLNEGDGPSVEQILEMRMKPGDYHVPPTRYREVLTMSSTAYEPGPRSCGRFASGNTAAGYEAGYGVVAVDTNVIPMHTRLFIEGYGYAVAGDRGSAIDGNDIDLGFLTVEECMEWGRREVKVYVLY